MNQKENPDIDLELDPCKCLEYALNFVQCFEAKQLEGILKYITILRQYITNVSEQQKL